MNALAHYMAAMHQQTLLEQADLDRLVKLNRSSTPSVPAWRRTLGGSAHRLSSFLASTARSLDPSIEANQRAARRAAERPVGRILSC